MKLLKHLNKEKISPDLTSALLPQEIHPPAFPLHPPTRALTSTEERSCVEITEIF